MLVKCVCVWIIPAGQPLPLPASSSQVLLRAWSNPCCLDQCLSSGMKEELLQPLLLLFLYWRTCIYPSAWINFTPLSSSSCPFSSSFITQLNVVSSVWEGLGRTYCTYYTNCNHANFWIKLLWNVCLWVDGCVIGCFLFFFLSMVSQSEALLIVTMVPDDLW